ncbi:MAG: DUF4491 family protein [Candidatus Zixiibacteriota bacterium]|nr:MAG: DUF4491 family protein [candidate division Zixibacteria bacterium]
MNFFGLIIGTFVLLVTGLLHILVVKAEYQWGTRSWPVFLLTGLICIVLSLFANSDLLSGILGITGILLFWSVHEIFKQRERVKKGWFPGKEA